MFKGLLLTIWITGYCPCTICCGPEAKGITSSGTIPIQGFTLASRQLPRGTILNIGGKDFMVQDKGGPSELGVDVFFNTHAEALKVGKKRVQVEVQHVPTGPKAMNKFLMSLPITGQVVDIASTYYAHSYGRGESNPAMRWAYQHPPAFEAAKISVGVGISMAGRSLHRRGHSGWAKTVWIIGGLGGWAPGVFNFIRGGK